MLRFVLGIMIVVLTFGCTSARFGPHSLPPRHAYAVTPERADTLRINEIDQPLVAGQINGVAGSFMVDTGASKTGLTATYAAHLGVRSLRGGEAWGVSETGSMRLTTGRVKRIAVANLVIDDYYVLIVPDGELRAIHALASVVPFDAVIGGDVLFQFRAVLDFGGRTLAFVAPGQALPPAVGKVVARLLPVPQSNTILLEARVSGEAVRLKVDTGLNEYGAISSASRVAGALGRVNMGFRKVYATDQVRDETHAYLVPDLTVGAVSQRNVILGIQVPPDEGHSAKLASRADGVLGSMFFIENGLIIDYGRMEVRQSADWHGHSADKGTRMPPGAERDARNGQR